MADPNTEIIEFPDAEAFTVAFLRREFDRRDIVGHVATRAPKKDIPEPLVLITAMPGQGQRDIITDSSRILIKCDADDTVTAAELAKKARALMLAAARLTDSVTRVQDGGGPAFVPDPATNRPRYQFLVDLDMRGKAI